MRTQSYVGAIQLASISSWYPWDPLPIVTCFSIFHRSNPINTHQLRPRKPSEEMAMKVIQNLRFGELSETCCQDNEKAAQCRMPRCPTWGRKWRYRDGWISLLHVLSGVQAGFNLGTPNSSQMPDFLQGFHKFLLDLFFLWWFLISTTSSYPGFGICYVWVILSLMFYTLLESWGPCQSVLARTSVALEARVVGGDRW